MSSFLVLRVHLVLGKRRIPARRSGALSPDNQFWLLSWKLHGSSGPDRVWYWLRIVMRWRDRVHVAIAIT